MINADYANDRGSSIEEYLLNMRPLLDVAVIVALEAEIEAWSKIGFSLRGCEDLTLSRLEDLAAEHVSQALDVAYGPLRLTVGAPKRAPKDIIVHRRPTTAIDVFDWWVEQIGGRP